MCEVDRTPCVGGQGGVQIGQRDPHVYEKEPARHAYIRVFMCTRMCICVCVHRCACPMHGPLSHAPTWKEISPLPVIARVEGGDQGDTRGAVTGPGLAQGPGAAGTASCTSGCCLVPAVPPAPCCGCLGPGETLPCSPTVPQFPRSK